MGPFSRVLGIAAIVGAGALAVGVVIAAPRLLQAARPAARAGLKRGMEIYARVQAAASEFVEDVEDLVAEVRSEITPAPHSGSGESDPAPSRKAGGG